MTLLLKNLQKLISLDLKTLKEHVYILRQLMNVEKYDLSISCVDNSAIAGLNKQYRNIEGPTDVLAFPFYEGLVPGEWPPTHHLEDGIYDLGDVILGVPYIHEQCVIHKENMAQVMPTMVTHGMCHLIGYDHETKEQYKQMYIKELDILSKFNKETGLNCKPLLGMGH